MGERTGIGVVELAILEALAARRARAGGRYYADNTKVLADVEARTGLAPGYAYEVLLDLARPWRLPVVLVEGEGDYGGVAGEPPAGFGHTWARLSAAGAVAVAAERGELAPVPVGLINGNTHRGGSRPPFRPAGIIEAVRRVIRRPRVTGRELAEVAGPPQFPAGCGVTGDFASLAAGRPTTLRLHAQVTIIGDSQRTVRDLAGLAVGRPAAPRLYARASLTGDSNGGGRGVVVEHIPPNADRQDLIFRLAAQSDAQHRHPGDRAGALPLAEVEDISVDGDDRFLCVPRLGTPPELLRDQLVGFDGITTVLPVALPRALPAMIRNWVRAYSGEDLLASLASLEDAISMQAVA